VGLKVPGADRLRQVRVRSVSPSKSSRLSVILERADDDSQVWMLCPQCRDCLQCGRELHLDKRHIGSVDIDGRNRGARTVSESDDRDIVAAEPDHVGHQLAAIVVMINDQDLRRGDLAVAIRLSQRTENRRSTLKTQGCGRSKMSA
jgi:hypothetical protein